MGPSENRQRDFFVSYTKADEAWAVWIAWIVEEMGFYTLVQAWDFLPGINWVEQMDAGLTSCARTIAVLSPDYAESVYGRAEWQATWVKDAPGSQRKLLPVRVRDFELSGLLATVVYTDLSGTDEATARGRLAAMLNATSSDRVKPGARPPFRGRQKPRQCPQFPSAAPPGQSTAVEGGTVSDNVTNLDDFRRRDNGDSADSIDAERFLSLLTDFFESAELIGTSYAAGAPGYTWTRLAVERKLAQTNSYIEKASKYLLRAGLQADLATFNLRHFIRQSAGIISAFSRALNALESGQRPSRRHMLLDEYETAKRSLETLLWRIHGELATVLPPSGSR